MFGLKRQKIDQLNLSIIAAGVAKRHGWPPERVQEAESEYRKFLYLMLLRPELTVTPWCDDLDLFWHEHVLHTQQYAADCQRLFGQFIHHDPTIASRPAENVLVQVNTAWAYFAAFGRKAAADSSSWRLPTAASLAAVYRLIPPSARRSGFSPASGVSCIGGGASCGSGGHGGGHSCGGGGHGCGGGGGGH